ncbi:MAG: hypothetical protein JOY99_04170 [Sphingomonadaceae bacterium]|nr:hypothetical protein [Sphingomonadaceae bacterium]
MLPIAELRSELAAAILGVLTRTPSGGVNETLIDSPAAFQALRTAVAMTLSAGAPPRPPKDMLREADLLIEEICVRLRTDGGGTALH